MVLMYIQSCFSTIIKGREIKAEQHQFRVKKDCRECRYHQIAGNLYLNIALNGPIRLESKNNLPLLKQGIKTAHHKASKL
jgi:hypothetical protein